MKQLLRIEAPHFVAGALFSRGRCVDAAPIIHWCVGKSLLEITSYCKRRAWKATLS